MHNYLDMMLSYAVALVAVVSVVTAQRPGWFDECEGFGCSVTKSYGKKSCVVSKLSESALKKCITQRNTHTTFTVSGTIKIRSRIECASGIIIDGSGQKVKFTGDELRIVSDSIVHRITFDTGVDDGLTLRGKYSNVWIHRCSFRNYGDGLVDITKGFTDVTVSWCRFEDHNKGFLIGASPSDTKTDRVTLHHNYWHNVVQRQPRIRYAYVHVYNSVYENWGSYAISSSQQGRLLSENNYFSSSKKADKNYIFQAGVDPKKGYLKSRGNKFDQGSAKSENKPSRVENPSYKYRLETANSKMIKAVRNGAGNV